VAADTQLTLANLGSNYVLLSTPAEAWPLQGKLDEVARDQLPRLLADCILPQIDPNYSVYRIRHITIDLAISRDSLKRGRLPQLWAQQIVQRIFHELRYGNSVNVARFATNADFIAAFIVDLVCGAAWHSWVYEEFAPLRHLTTGDAVVEILSSRPTAFLIIVQYVNRRGLDERLLELLDERQVRRIIQALSRLYSARPQAKRLLLFGEHTLAKLQTTAGQYISTAHCHLYFLLRLISAPTVENDFDTALELSRQTALLQQALLQLPTAIRYALHEAFVLSREGVKPLPEGVPLNVIEVLMQHQHQDQGPEYLRWLLGTVACLTPGLAEPVLPRVKHDKPKSDLKDAETAEDGQQFSSAFAGFSLLLMTIKELKLNNHLSMAQLRQCLMLTVDFPARRLCELDPLWGALFPIDELTRSLLPWPEVDETFLQGLGHAQQAAVSGAEAVDAWGKLILHRFARRLPGLEASSIAYLRQQFLQRSGRIFITPETVTVSLAPMPLGVVLKMAGLNGWQGRLSWLQQRELIIEIPVG